MKNLYTLLLALAFSSQLFAQCTIDPWSLEKRIDRSDLVLEGKVISSEGIWDRSHHLIYTLHQVEVYKVFKGSAASTIYLATVGGSVGLEMLQASPSLELEANSIGVFLLKNGKIGFAEAENVFQPTASVQSFIPYNLTEYAAFDLQNKYLSITYELYPEIEKFTNEKHKTIKAYDPESTKIKIKPLANPSISSFSLDTLSSGTTTLLTINGSNFGFARGNGKVGFKDANYGDGRYYYSPVSDNYVSWSNSKIEIYVPSRAGSGTVQVVNNLNESGESSNDLEIKWAHSNVFYISSGDTSFYETDHVNDNSAGGYTWQMNPKFASNQAAVNAFTRSLEEWRCETQMNWDIGTPSNIDTVSSDNINIVRFTDFGDSKLGVCYSWYSGCFFSGGINWYVKELDIEFDSTYGWYYGTGTPSSNQYDFETVATHELGHGHQLGHVRDNSKVMFYALGPGQRKVDLVSSDIEGGNYVKSKSIASSPCGPSNMQAVAVNACLLRPPFPLFIISDTIICPSNNITISNTTETGDNSYAWDFGSGSNPSSAITYGPHTVSYTTSGAKIIRLIATNFIGSDTLEKMVFVKVNALDAPKAFGQEDSSCLGNVTYQIDAVANAESYLWSASAGGSIFGASNLDSAAVNWTAAGNQTISVKAINECTESNVTQENVFVIANPTSSFTYSDNGTSLTFTNTSQNAQTYFWNFGDGNTSTETNATHQYPDKGNYTVKLVSTNSCNADSNSQQINVNFRAGVLDVSKSIKVYPNPVKAGELITIEGEQFDTYTVYTTQGKEVKNGKVLGNGFKIEALAAGSYVVHLQNSTNSETRVPIQIIE